MAARCEDYRSRSSYRLRLIPAAVLTLVALLTLGFGPFPSATASASTNSYQVTVPGTSSFTNSEIYLQAGDRVAIEAAGDVYVAQSSVAISPDGFSNPAGSSYVAPGLRTYSLVGCIGGLGGWFQVGGCSSFTASKAGYLVLAVNDEWFGDNSGQWTVWVSVTCGGTSPGGGQKSLHIWWPNGGENMVVGTQEAAQWTTTGSVPLVDVLISRDGGQTWKLVAENISNTGYLLTTVGTPTSDSCLIGIGDSYSWNGNWYSVWDQSDRTFRITAPVSTYTVNASAPAGHGSVSPTSKSVQAGGSVDITMSPDSGYKVGKVTDNGADVTSQVVPLYGGGEGYSDYRLVNVQANHTVVVTFSQKAPTTYRISTSTSGGGGTITPANPDITAGSSATLTVTPSSGYEIDTVYVDEAKQTVSQRSGYIVQLSNIQGPHTVTASFRVVSTASGWGAVLTTWNGVEIHSNFPTPNYDANGDGDWDDQWWSDTGWKWQCVELAQRLYYVNYAKGWVRQKVWAVDYAAQMFDYADSLGLKTVLNGQTPGPQPGDLIVYSYTPGSGYDKYGVAIGHVSVVTSAPSGGSVGVAEQNWSTTGTAALDYGGGWLSDSRDSGKAVIRGWIRHPVSGSAQFSDTSGSPYSAAIADVAEDGVVGGFDDGTFRPNALLTRQQFAKMIVLALGLTVTGNEVCPFVDVEGQLGSDPFYPSKYVAVCAAHGITTGKTATIFGPNDSITREQLITMVVRAASLPSPSSSFSPVFSSGQFSWDQHYQNARKAAYAGLLSGLQGLGLSYNFEATATRGECAQILYNLRQR
jgi:hypothetical protein